MPIQCLCFTRARALLGWVVASWCFLLLVLAGASIASANGQPPVAVLVENVGQFAPEARFAILTGPGQAWIAEDALWITLAEPNPTDPTTLRGSHIRLSFPGARWEPTPAYPLPARVSYFLGNDPAAWHPEVPAWGTVRWPNLYPGVDLVFGSGADPTWPWQLQATRPADLAAVRLRIEGASRVALAGNRLLLTTSLGDLSLPLLQLPAGTTAPTRPTLRTLTNGSVEVIAPFATSATREPQAGTADLLYSSFLGGDAAENGYAVATDSAGLPVLAGDTQSTNFPTTPGAFDGVLNNQDAFLLKLNPAGTGATDLVAATFLGGASLDAAYALALDASDNATLVGNTSSASFPTTAGAFDRTCNSGADCLDFEDAFIARLNPNGTSLLYASFLGGDDNDIARGVALDASGNIFVTGNTTSAGFPTTANAYDRTCGSDGQCDPSQEIPYDDAFLVKLSPAGGGSADLLYSTFLGGADTDRGFAVAVASGKAYLAGDTYSTSFLGNTNAGESDAFAVQLNPALSGTASLVYARLLGGSAVDSARGITADASGNAYLVGETRSANFPASNTYAGGTADAFLVRLNASGTSTYAKFVGGSGRETAYAVDLNSSGQAVMAGFTFSTDFPTTADAYDTSPNGGRDAFVLTQDLAQPSPLYSTYLGGSADDEAYALSVDALGMAFLAGYTKSTAFPTTPGAYDTSYSGGLRDGFLTKLIVQPTGTLAVTKAVDWNGVASDTGQVFEICITGPSHQTASCQTTGYLGGTLTWENLIPGSYTITETNPGSQWQVTIDGSPATIPSTGGTVSASVANEYKAGTLVVTKVLTNDNGGSKSCVDFSFQVGSASPVSFETGCTNTLVLDTGTYAVTEPAVAGYTTTYDNCASIAVPTGGTATCTITNDDQPGTLIVQKDLVNDNGGTKACPDFSFQVDGGAATPFEADCINQVTVDAGTYSVSEPAVAGYTTTYNSCTGIAIANGGSATCIITNNDQPGTLVVNKVVVNDDGGSKGCADFSFRVNSGSAIPFEVDCGNSLTVNAGTYSVAEPAVSGYSTTYAGCSSISIPNGGSATCTITNDDVKRSVAVDKQVKGYSDGEWYDFLTEIMVGVPETYRFVVSNAGEISLDTVEVTDPALAQQLGLDPNHVFCSTTDLAPATAYTCPEVGPLAAVFTGRGSQDSNTASAEGCGAGVCATDSDTAYAVGLYWAFRTTFWKTYTPAEPSGKDAWTWTAWMQGDSVCDAFAMADLYVTCTDTLRDALYYRGGRGAPGAAQLLLRAGTAALLNGSFHEKTHAGLAGDNGEVYFPYYSTYETCIGAGEDAAYCQDHSVAALVSAALASEDIAEMQALAAELDGYNDGIEFVDWANPAALPPVSGGFNALASRR